MIKPSLHPSFGTANVFDLVHQVGDTNPEALGLVYPGGQLSYRQLSDSVVYLAEELRAKGVGPGQLVAVDLPPHLDFVALLSINLLGATSCAVYGMPNLPTNLSPDWLLGSPTSTLKLKAENTLRVSADALLTKVPSISWKEMRETAGTLGSTPARLVYTSGTTAQPKAVVFSSALVEAIVNQAVKAAKPNQSSLSLIYFSRLGLSAALVQIARGLPVGLSSPKAIDSFDVASKSEVTEIVGSPIQILGLVTYLIEQKLELPNLEKIGITGGAVGQDLFDTIRELSTKIAIELWYGSNEVGRVSSLEITEEYIQGNVGTLLPGVEIEIVNEHGNPTEDGQVGLIRIRTNQMASEYFNDVFQTSSNFVGGWFQPGDLGLIDFDDNLILQGRTTDLVNAGGNKINPAMIEAKLLTLAGISDCAGLEVSSPKGITEFAVALVGPEPIDTVRLSKLLISYFPQEHPTVYAQIDSIPRNQNGKVNRRELRSWFEGKLT